MGLEEIAIILCRPAEAGNIGAVCRALKNSGLGDLRIVAGAPVDEAALRSRAVHAADIWERARRCETLREAIADCSLVIGTTRRRGRYRKMITITARCAARFLRGYTARGAKAALVFGNERTGLERGELELCNMASHISAHAAFPSLNLSHSVQVYGYELYRALKPAKMALFGPPEGTARTIDRGRQDELTGEICDALAMLGFYKQPGRAYHEELFRDIFARAGLTQKESRYLHAICAKASRIGALNKDNN
ncbi:MAG: RNA methyltransferase [Spirochaetaceae bacterium]|jgi:TrmH family RNA methyltransferase|nr:RNA methyltransferase [Spirochaetaceae bacterium]